MTAYVEKDMEWHQTQIKGVVTTDLVNSWTKANTSFMDQEKNPESIEMGSILTSACL